MRWRLLYTAITQQTHAIGSNKYRPKETINSITNHFDNAVGLYFSAQCRTGSHTDTYQTQLNCLMLDRYALLISCKCATSAAS